MTTPLFQQLLTILKEAQPEVDINDITSWDVLVDELYIQCQNNVNFLAHRFDQLLNMYYQLLHNQQAQGTNLTICSNLYEIFVIMVERRPILITKNPNRMLNMVQKLYEMFVSVDFQCDQEWMKPQQGYNDENDFSEENTLSKQMMSYIDRIANKYTYPKFIEFFNSVLPTWWTNSENDWKARYSLIMIMSQLGEDVEYPLTVKSFIDCGVQSVTHQHPKVRYGALQMLGQLADDMKPGFQQVYGQQLMPLILGCTKDEVPRVQGHAMACLTNFLQDFEHEDYHILSPYVDEIINVSENFCYNGISIVKENTISTLASLSSIDLLTSQQVEKVLTIVNHLLTFELHQKPEYNQLMNQTVECLSMILYGQKEKVEKVLTQSINVLKSLKSRISASYLVNSWSRICLKYDYFTDLSDIFPHILQSVTLMIENFQSELQPAIRSILNTINAFKGHIKPYTTNIVQFCKNGFIKLSEDAALKSVLYQIFDALVITLKSEAPDPQWEEMSKDIFTFLYEEVQKLLKIPSEDMSDYLSLEQALGGLQKCISHVNNLFTGENTTTFSQTIFNFATRISELIKEVKADIDMQKLHIQGVEDQIEKEDFTEVIALDEEKLQKLYTSRLVIPDIFESILTVVPKESQAVIVQSLYPYVSNFLQKELPFEDIRYGLYFLCDFLSALKYEGIQEYANVYESKFGQFCLSPNIEVRNCAVFGLGEFMKQIPVEKTDQNMIYNWLNLLWNSLSLSFSDNNDKKRFNFARDNIVSALGKLIYSKRSCYPVALNQQVHKKWFEYLPLNHDKVQGNIQHEILLDLLDQTPQTFILTKQDVTQLLTIFAKYFSKRMLKTEDLILKNKKRTKEYLFKMKEWPIFQENCEFLWSSLAANHREILTQLMSAP